MPVKRGYFGIGIYNTKNILNIGTLWRSAANFQADFMFTVGRRFKQQSSDTLKAQLHIPLFQYADIADFKAHIPYNCQVVGVEQTPQSRALPGFTHPDRCIYLLGAEDAGLPEHVIALCQHVVEIPTFQCLNVAVAGAVVMYDRTLKRS